MLSFSARVAGFLFLLSVALVAPALSACCVGGEDYLYIGNGYTSFDWDAPNLSLGYIQVEHRLEVSPQGPILEFYRDGEPFENEPEVMERDNATENGCGFSMVYRYPIDSLPPGSYEVVHREANGTADEVYCFEGCPWTEFEGERALVMRLEGRSEAEE